MCSNISSCTGIKSKPMNTHMYHTIVMHDKDDIGHIVTYCNVIMQFIYFSCRDIEYDITQLYAMFIL